VRRGVSRRVAGSDGVSLLAVAMLAVGDVLEPRDRDEPVLEVVVDGEPDDGDEPLVVWLDDASPGASYALIRDPGW
jgi:hypothetical protein